MTFYVANNYVQGQADLAQQNYAKELPGILLRKLPPQQQHSLTRFAIVPRGGTRYRLGAADDKKFIPSVQFDPRNIGGDNDYFAPVKYNTKINYDYSTPTYELYQIPEITTPSNQILHQDNRYFSSPRPVLVRPAVREHLIKKPPVGNPQDNYDQDYAARPNAAVGYGNKEFESLRYIPPSVRPPTKLYETTERKTVPSIYRKPNVNLKSIIESFQLTERLPEMLSKDNIDSSIKTLMEILNILYKARKEDISEAQELPLPPLPPLPSLPAVPTLPPRLHVYNRYKPKPYTRPKVITETKFQVTPNPLFITDDPERYKSTALVASDVQAKTPSQSDYTTNHVKEEKIEYYIPYIQDLSDEPEQPSKSTVRPVDKVTENSYEIMEELTDEILEDERYTLPISTETTSTSHATPNEITPPEPKVPQSPLKYGATRGKPHVDYPAYATIPETDFSCKEQRYKGFFGDPATRCQVSSTFV